VFEVTGRSQPILDKYPAVDVGDIYAKTCEIVKGLDELERENPAPPMARDAIVFLPATGHITQMVTMLEKLNDSLDKKVLPIPITAADVNNVTQNLRLVLETDPTKLFVPGSDSEVAFRRVIVSTNVAETGLTLESLRYCVDSGMQFVREFIPRHGAALMTVKPVTRGMSLKRRGRVGRKHPGVFSPLYTEITANYLAAEDTPKIEVEDFT
jgi:HrpA-like RNA helicase